MIDHFLQMLYIIFALMAIYLLWVLVFIGVVYIFEKIRSIATMHTSSLNMPNASPENSVDITSRHLRTDESSNAPNHYTWHNQHISPLQRLPPMSDITKQEIIPSPYQPETIIDVMDETSTDELCCICLVSQEKLYCFAKCILSFVFALQFPTDYTFAMKKTETYA